MLGARTPGVLTGVALGAIVAAAALVRAWGLARQGFWYDEAITAWIVRESPGQLLAAIPHTESTPPLYYLVACGWVRLFGDTEAGLRSLSALAGTAAVPLAFAAGRELAGRRAGLVAALLVAFNPLLVWYSQEARSYSLMVALTAASFWLFARALRNPSPRRLVAWAAVGAAALSTHYFAVFVVAPEALWLLGQRRAALNWRLVATGVLVLTAGGLAVLAWSQRGHTHWQAIFPLRVRIEQVPAQLVAGFTPPAGTAARLLIAAGVGALLVVAPIFASRAERRAALVAVAIAAAAVCVPVLLALARVDYLNTRNLIGAAVPLAVGLGVCATVRAGRGAGLAVALLIAAVSATAIAAVGDDAAAQRPHWRSVAAALTAPPSTQRAILLHGSSTWSMPLAFYLPHTWWTGSAGVRAREVQVLARLPARSICSRSAWWGASCAMHGTRPPRRAPAPGFHRVSVKTVAGFSITTWRSPRAVRIFQPQRRRRHRKLLSSTRALPLVP
jgi:mannosyltransferase